MTILNSLTIFNSIAFIFYGITCIASASMKLEFIRFGLAPFRLITGILQIFGGLVLGISWYYNFPLLASIAAGGLSLLMLLGFGVRLKIKDTFAQSTPALFFCILNIYLCYKYFELAEVMNV